MNGKEADRLAIAVHALRPDWPAQSLRSFITNNLTDKNWSDAAVAFAWIATDPATKTPARVLEVGPWWSATAPRGQSVPLPPRYTPERITPADPVAVAGYTAAIRSRINERTRA